jgi:hypothetical protein
MRKRWFYSSKDRSLIHFTWGEYFFNISKVTMIGPYNILPFRHWLDTYLILGKYKYSHYTVTSQKFHSSNLSFLNTSVGILCLIFITIYNLKHFLSTSMKIRFYIRLFRYLDVSIPRHTIVRHDIYMSVYQSILVLFQHPFSE